MNRTIEQKKNISEKLKQYFFNNPEAKQRVVKNLRPDYWLGKHRSDETKKKLREAFKGKPSWNKGIKLSEKHKNNLKGKRPNASGDKNWNWKGTTPLKGQIRTSFEYRQWRSDIFTRDNFTCQECSDDKGGNLEAHHKKSFSEIIEQHQVTTLEDAKNCEELWNINNGITLCIGCHKKTDGYMNRWIK